MDLKTQGMIWWLIAWVPFLSDIYQTWSWKNWQPRNIARCREKKTPTKALHSKDQKRGSIAIQNYFSMIIVLLQTNIENTVAQLPPQQQIKKFNFEKCTWVDEVLVTILEFLLLLLPKYFAPWYCNHKWLFFDRFNSTKKLVWKHPKQIDGVRRVGYEPIYKSSCASALVLMFLLQVKF